MTCAVSHQDPIDPIPAPPDLTAAGIAAGDSFGDPTFGTTLMRVTDGGDGDRNMVAYSYWPAFNKDSSRLFINTGTAGPPEELSPTLYDFDATNFKISNKRPLPSPNGHTIHWEGTIWSGKDPAILYTFEGLNIWRCDVSRNPPKYDETPLKSFSADFSDSPVADLWQMSKSLDDSTFAFTLRDDSERKIGYAVWRQGEGIVLREDVRILSGIGALDEVHIDKSGDFLVVLYVVDDCPDPDPKALAAQVWTLTGDPPAAVDLNDGDPHYAPGHYDTGNGTLVGHDRWGTTRTTFRTLADPCTVTTVLDLADVHQAYHVSMLADVESTALLSFYAKEATPGPFHGEIIRASTNGETNPCRLAHHHSVAYDYWDEPHANISRDGKFVAFTSNWGSKTRKDVFIVQAPAL